MKGDIRTKGVEELLDHRDWLRRLTSTLVRGGEEAQDLVQETLLVGSTTATLDGVELRAWLGGVARRGTWRDLLNALMQLPEAQRRAVMARYYDGWPPRRIAAEQGVPLATVKSQIQRGLAGLRTRLDADYGDRQTWGVAFLPLAHSSSRSAGAPERRRVRRGASGVGRCSGRGTARGRPWGEGLDRSGDARARGLLRRTAPRGRGAPCVWRAAPVVGGPGELGSALRARFGKGSLRQR